MIDYRAGMRRFLLATLLTLAAAPRTQIGLGEVGFQLISNNTQYGTLCSRTFACTYLPADLYRGQNAELIVRGVLNQWYIVGLWFDVPHACLSLPGAHNQLFSTAFIEPFFGLLTQQDQIRVCPGGIVRLPLSVPAGVPVGQAITLQALTYSYLNSTQVPTFTHALRATFR
jgi:hypothetical protein